MLRTYVQDRRVVGFSHQLLHNFKWGGSRRVGAKCLPSNSLLVGRGRWGKEGGRVTGVDGVFRKILWFCSQQFCWQKNGERERERYHSSAQADYHVLIYFRIVLTRSSDITPMHFVIYDTVWIFHCTSVLCFSSQHAYCLLPPLLQALNSPF